MEKIVVNKKTYKIIELLGRGKGGYSYLASGEGGECVVKKLHHEPCDFYTFTDKFERELRDHAVLLAAGIRMPALIDSDRAAECIVKEYIDGPTAMQLAERGALLPGHIEQIKEFCSILYPLKLNIDYYPTNFVVRKNLLYYIDYECNEYSEEWDLEHWGQKFWLNAR